MGNRVQVAPISVCHGTPVGHASVKLGLPAGHVSLEDFATRCPDVVIEGRPDASLAALYRDEAIRDTCRKRFVISVLVLTGVAAATMGALRMFG